MNSRFAPMRPRVKHRWSYVTGRSHPPGKRVDFSEVKMKIDLNLRVLV